MSLYLRCTEGLSEANKAILEEATAALATVAGPWIIAADWNFSPLVLAESGWLKIVGGILFASELPTCNDSRYDDFIVHKSLAHAVVGVQRLDDGGCNPHWPTRLIVRGDARRFAIRKLERPPKVEAILPHGPSRPHPSYDDVFSAAHDPSNTNAAATAWYTKARQ